MKFLRFMAFLLSTGLTLAFPNSAGAQARPCTSIPALDHFDILDFLNQIKLRHLTSVDQALCLIPPQIKNNFVMVHKSKSAQGASPDFPRVIMFEPSTNPQIFEPVHFAISFNGHPSEANFQHLEVMKFDPSASDHDLFQFTDVDFSDPDKGAVVSAPNPKECIKCHAALGTSIPRPFWNAQGFFPGVFGRSTFRLAPDTVATAALPGLTKLSGTDSRYSQIRAGLLARSKVDKGRLVQMISMNEEFTARLGLANQERILRLLKASPNYSNYKFAILGALFQCDTGHFVEKFIPKAVADAHLDRSYISAPLQDGLKDAQLDKARDIFARTSICDTPRCPVADFNESIFDAVKDLEDVVKPFGIDDEIKAGAWGTSPGHGIDYLRWLLEGRGLSMQEFALDVGFDGYYRLINAGFSNSHDQAVESYSLSQRLCQSEPDFMNIPEAPKVCGINMSHSIPDGELEGYLEALYKEFPLFCRRLAEASQARLANLPPPATAPTPDLGTAFPRVFVSTCSRCHVSGNAPAIPFNNPQDLSDWLGKNPSFLSEIKDRIESTYDPMPPTGSLPDKQVQEIKNYLQKVSSE